MEHAQVAAAAQTATDRENIDVIAVEEEEYIDVLHVVAAAYTMEKDVGIVAEAVQKIVNFVKAEGLSPVRVALEVGDVIIVAALELLLAAGAKVLVSTNNTLNTLLIIVSASSAILA